MTKAQEQNPDLAREELIKLIKKNSTNIIPLLKQDINSLPLFALHQLYEISGLEAHAKEMCKSYASDLSKYAIIAFETLQTGLKELNLSDDDKKVVNNIYKQTILVAVTKASKKLLDPLKEGKGYLYNKILSEQTVDILDSILEFKKSIDQYFPGLSDKIIAAAIPAITALVSTYAPPVGLALKTTGILDKAAEYIKTDKLEETIEKMRSDLGILEEDKQLAKAQKLGTELVKLSESVGISATSLQKAGITLKNIEEVSKEVSKHKEAAEFLQEVCKYTEKHVPDSISQIEELFEGIKQAAIKDLQSKGAPEALIVEFEKVYEEAAILAELKMEESLKSNASAFDKITAIQQAADIMDKSQDKVTKTLSQKYPDNKEAISAAVNIVNKEVKKEIRGDLKELASKMTKGTTAKTLAKKCLGAGLASKITIKRTQSKEQQQIRS